MGVTTSPSDGSLFAPALATLYGVAFLAGAAMGLFNPLISTLMAQHQVSDLAIGANSTVFFLFLMLAAPLAAYVVRRAGARVAMTGGLLLTAIAAVQVPLYESLTVWFVIRAVMGVGVGLYMISGQTALNQLAGEHQRALTSGIYALAFGLGLGAGPLLGATFYSVSPLLAFVAGAGFLLLGLPAVLAFLPAVNGVLPRAHAGLFNTLSVPLHGVFAYGVAEATLMSLYPIFLLHQGYGVGQIGFAFSVFVAGSILSTLPLSWLADRIGHERVLFGSACAGVLSTVALVLAEQVIAVNILSFIAGASIGPVFAVSLALMGKMLPRDQLPCGSALFTLAFSLGSMIAPLCTALVMRAFGDGHIFSLTVVLFAGLMLRLAWQSRAWKTSLT